MAKRCGKLADDALGNESPVRFAEHEVSLGVVSDDERVVAVRNRAQHGEAGRRRLLDSRRHHVAGLEEHPLHAFLCRHDKVGQTDGSRCHAGHTEHTALEAMNRRLRARRLDDVREEVEDGPSEREETDLATFVRDESRVVVESSRAQLREGSARRLPDEDLRARLHPRLEDQVRLVCGDEPHGFVHELNEERVLRVRVAGDHDDRDAAEGEHCLQEHRHLRDAVGREHDGLLLDRAERPAARGPHEREPSLVQPERDHLGHGQIAKPLAQLQDSTQLEVGGDAGRLPIFVVHA